MNIRLRLTQLVFSFGVCMHAAANVGISLDRPSVGTYSVQENTPEGHIQICAVANASVTNNAVVTISTRDVTANSKIYKLGYFRRPPKES